MYTYVLARPDAAATRGFRMVLLSRPSKQLCRRYMRSTERPSSFAMLPSLAPSQRMRVILKLREGRISYRLSRPYNVLLLLCALIDVDIRANARSGGPTARH